jgi:AcrR family transcriptional regulator
MKKGDIRKREILKVAEELFCKKGYEETSIQDILDVLHSSKGSFYHHYESKESLLEAMCIHRAEQIALKTIEESDRIDDPMKKLNCLMTGVFPFSDERLSFLMMLLPVFSTREGKSVRNCYCDALLTAFRKNVAEQLERCSEAGLTYYRDATITASICLLIINNLWCAVCDSLISSSVAGENLPDLSLLISQTRIAVERIISAPYGSLELICYQDVMLLAEHVRIHWKKD